MTHRSMKGPRIFGHGDGPATLRSLTSLTIANLRLYVREPIGAFFTLAFPVMLVLIFGAIFGNQPEDMFGGAARWTFRCLPTPR